jgi:phosphatidate cytidylyltransferase
MILQMIMRLSMLKQRVITAIILVTLLGVSLFQFPALGFVAVISLIVLLASWEWSNLAGLGAIERPIFCVAVALLSAASFYSVGFLQGLIDTALLQKILLIAAAWWALALLLVQGYPGAAIWWQHRFMRALMGVVVLYPAWLAFVYLRFLPQGEFWLIALVAIVAAADIGAYFTGRKFGRRKLALQVSPGKSWEGFWGGLLTVMVIASAASAANIFGGQLSFAQLIVIALITALASVLGDLVESMVKRQRGIKDSGWMLPGHGGFMDRLDSLSAAAPIFALSLLATLPPPIAGVLP